MTDESAASRDFAARLEAQALARREALAVGVDRLALGWLASGEPAGLDRLPQTRDAQLASERERRRKGPQGS